MMVTTGGRVVFSPSSSTFWVCAASASSALFWLSATGV